MKARIIIVEHLSRPWHPEAIVLFAKILTVFVVDLLYWLEKIFNHVKRILYTKYS